MFKKNSQILATCGEYFSWQTCQSSVESFQHLNNNNKNFYKYFNNFYFNNNNNNNNNNNYNYNKMDFIFL